MPRATEAEIQKGLIDYLGYQGFEVFHTRYSIGSDPGFPDVVAAREGQIVAIEVKGAKGRLRPMQREWIDLFRSVPGCLFAEVVGPTASSEWIGYDDALARLAEVL